MEKEKYNRTQVEIIEFSTKDVICSSDLVEDMPGENGGGVLSDP